MFRVRKRVLVLAGVALVAAAGYATLPLRRM